MPLFSILIPSRDRLNLLKYAISSIRSQDFSDFEIVVSDNFSKDDYKSYISNLKDKRINFIRTSEVISVTSNWNRALDAAKGQYVLMLGDDDALTPGLLSKLADLIRKHENPDFFYLGSYHYLYPDVNPAAPAGAFQKVVNSALFVRPDGEKSYEIPLPLAREMSEAAVNFKHLVSFNAQHFVWRRDFTKTTRHKLFEPPYPDYFACFYSFSHANKIVIIPEPSIIIGISKQSFGYFFINNQQDEGARAFAGEEFKASDFAPQIDARSLRTLDFSGPMHYRNWLLASMQYKYLVDRRSVIDVDRYCKIQIVETVFHCLSSDMGDFPLRRHLQGDWKPYRDFVKWVWRRLKESKKQGLLEQDRFSVIIDTLDVYYKGTAELISIGDHCTILDAYKYLEAHHDEYRPRKKSRSLYGLIGLARRALRT